MIIKKKLKSQMPSLKRRRLGSSNSVNGDSLARKKTKLSNGHYYPLDLLGESAAGILPGIVGAKVFAASWCSELSCPASELKQKLNGGNSAAGPRSSQATEDSSRLPLVRTSRGRVQVLPSRFSDSVIDNWRKDTKISLQDYSLDEDYAVPSSRKEKSGQKSVKTVRNGVKSRIVEQDLSFEYSRNGTLFLEGDREECRRRNFHFTKYSSSSRSSLTSSHEHYNEWTYESAEEPVYDLREENGGGREDGLYGPEDFYSGDIVWAKSGKSEPFWPAIVIDPMTQAPDLVLRACIADAACVMFFGYSGSEDQRVCTVTSVIALSFYNWTYTAKSYNSLL